MIVVEMNYRLDLVTVINQGDVISDSDIAMVAWRRRELAIEFGRCRMRSLTEIPVENGTLMETVFLIRGKPVSIPETSRRVCLVLVIPVVRNLSIMFVELNISSVLAIPLSTIPILGNGNGSGRRNQDRR